MGRDVSAAMLAGRTVALLAHGVVPSRLCVGGQGETEFQAITPPGLEVLVIDAGAAAASMLCGAEISLTQEEVETLSVCGGLGAARRREIELAQNIVGQHLDAVQAVQSLLYRKMLVKPADLLANAQKVHEGLFEFRSLLLRPEGVSTITPRLRAALHEAGHCIAFAAGGVKATALRVSDDGNGFCGTPDKVDPAADVLGSIAGYLAPRVCAGDVALPINDDDKKHVEMAIYLAWEADPTRARDDAAWKKAERQAVDLLLTHRAAVLALAKQLDADGEMTPDQIRPFIPAEFQSCYPAPRRAYSSGMVRAY